MGSVIDRTCRYFDTAMKTDENLCVTFIMGMGCRQCLTFSWTTLRGKHCRRPIVAVMGFAHAFGHELTDQKNYVNQSYQTSFITVDSAELKVNNNKQKSQNICRKVKFDKDFN